MHIALSGLLFWALTIPAQEPQPDPVPQAVVPKSNDSGAARPRSSRLPSVPLVRPPEESRLHLSNLTEVQTELNLSAEQKQAVANLSRDLSDRHREMFVEFQKRLAEVNREFDQSTKKLLDPKQSARMDQLQLQRVGPVALFSSEMARELALTEDQQSTLQARLRALAPAASLAFSLSESAGLFEIQSNYSRLTENQQKVVQQLLTTLTPEQRAKWDEKVGAKFNFAGPPVERDRTRDRAAWDLRMRMRNRTEAFELGGTNRSLETQMPMAAAVRLYGPIGPFRFKSTVDALALSPEQANQIRNVAAAHAEAIRKISGDPNEATNERVSQIDSETKRELDKLLTDAQQKKLTELIRL